jgi:hypothetical protein
MELASSHPSDAFNLEVAAGFLENLFNPHKYSAFSVFCCVERRKLV